MFPNDVTSSSIEDGFSINSSIIGFNGDDLFGNNNNPESLDSKPEVIKNAFTLEFMSLTFLINSKPLPIGICKSEITRSRLFGDIL